MAFQWWLEWRMEQKLGSQAERQAGPKEKGRQDTRNARLRWYSLALTIIWLCLFLEGQGEEQCQGVHRPGSAQEFSHRNGQEWDPRPEPSAHLEVDGDRQRPGDQRCPKSPEPPPQSQEASGGNPRADLYKRCGLQGMEAECQDASSRGSQTTRREPGETAAGSCEGRGGLDEGRERSAGQQQDVGRRDLGRREGDEGASADRPRAPEEDVGRGTEEVPGAGDNKSAFECAHLGLQYGTDEPFGISTYDYVPDHGNIASRYAKHETLCTWSWRNQCSLRSLWTSWGGIRSHENQETGFADVDSGSKCRSARECGGRDPEWVGKVTKDDMNDELCAQFQSSTEIISVESSKFLYGTCNLEDGWHHLEGRGDCTMSLSKVEGCTVRKWLDRFYLQLQSSFIRNDCFVKKFLNNPRVFVLEKFHNLHVLLQFLIVLLLMTCGWSLILLATYHSYFANALWTRVFIRKRRHFVNKTWYSKIEMPEQLKGKVLPWRKKRRRWHCLAPAIFLTIVPTLEAMQANERTQQPVDVFTPQEWQNPPDASNDFFRQGTYRDITVHQLDSLSTSFKMPTNLPLWRLRSAIGQHRRLHLRQDHWDNFMVYQVQPQPSTAKNPLDLHFVIELPNDRLPSESLIVIERKEIRPTFSSQLDVWRVKNALSRDELIHEIGVTHECGEQRDKCLIFVLGDLWHPQQDYIRMLPNGALVKVMYSLEENEGDCRSNSGDTSSSQASFDRRRFVRPSLDDSESEEDYSLMQLPDDARSWTRARDDMIFRLLSGRRHLLRLPDAGGFGVALWALDGHPTTQGEILRVWLDPTSTSWEELCLETLYSQTSAAREGRTLWSFHLPTPRPPPLSMSSRSINLICVTTNGDQEGKALLVDIFNPTWTRRVAVSFIETETVFMLAARILGANFQHLEVYVFQAVWQSGDGDLVLHDHDALTLPCGAYIELSRHERNDDHCSLLQATTDLKKKKNPDLVFRPYGQSGTSANFSSEGHAPVTHPSSHFCLGQKQTNATVQKKHQSSFLRWRDLSRLSFARSPIEGLQPPGNPCRGNEGATNISFFDTLDYDDVNEGVPIVTNQETHNQDIQEILRGIATPAKSQREPREVGTMEQQSPKQAEFFSMVDEDEALEDTLSETPVTCDQMTSHKISLDTHAEDEIFEEILFYHPELHRVHQAIDAFDLHPSTIEWLETHQCLDFDTFDPFSFSTLQVHTDGSYNGLCSSWCFVLTAIDAQGETYFIGYVAAKVDLDKSSPSCAGTTRHGASQAEIEALHWASWWVSRFISGHSWTGRLIFKWDSQVAGMKAQGLAENGASHSHGSTASRLRSFQHVLGQLLGWDQVWHEHTKAHSGEPLNELADVISKKINESGINAGTPFPAPLQIEALSPRVFELLWYYVLTHNWQQDPVHELPDMRDGIVHWTTTSTPATNDPETIQAWSKMIAPFSTALQKECVEMTFNITFASYNVLSLGNHLERNFSLHDEPGRVALLRKQVHHKGILFMGLQETRTPKGTYASETHLRYSTGAEEGGHGGVELWVSKVIPFAKTATGKLCFVTQANLHLQVAEPSILLMSLENCGLDLLLGVLHAPHTGHDDDRQQEWWSYATQMIDKFSSSKHIVLMIDANAKIGEHVDMGFGGYTIDNENKNGERLRQLANTFSLCAPSSYQQLHWGQLATWTHPGTGSVSRLDYVLCPQSWLHGEVASWVDADCSAGHAIPDHSCVCMSIKWYEWAKHREQARVPFDRHRLAEKSSEPILAAILNNAPKFDWQMDANEHAHKLTTWLHEELQHHFPRRPKNRSTPVFADDATVTEHAYVVTSKRQCRLAQRMLHDLILRRAFVTWKGEQMPGNLRHWMHALRLKIYRLKFEMGHHSHQLRLALRADRRRFVQQIAESATEAPPTEIFKKLRPILKPNKKFKAGPAALPRLRRQDGSYTEKLEEVNDLWVQHFAMLEAGTVMQPEAFFQKAIQEQPMIIKPSEYGHAELPQLHWLERAIRKLKTGKAPGPDLLQNEVLKSNPAAAARMLLPLLWKTVLRLEEPIVLKGGRLIPIPKKNGPQETCDAHRGILLMSCLGKVLRSAARPLVAQPFVVFSDPMQLGGKPGVPVQFGCQAVRAFQGFAKAKIGSSSIIFADVQSAYYKVLRELAVGSQGGVTAHQVIARFQLEECTARTLHEVWAGFGGQEALGGSPLQVALMASSLSSTWFTCSGNEAVATERGTRPGDSWADITFSVIMNAVLNKIRQRLRDADILFCLPAFDSTAPMVAQPTADTLPVFQTCWADDLTLFLYSQIAAHLPAKTATASHIMVHTLKEHGMDVTVGEGKTAIIMAPRGKGALEVRRHYFTTSKATLPVLFEHQTLMIPLVNSYRHLGGQVVSNASLMPEIQSRHKKAKSIFWRAAKQVFRSKHLPISTRKRLFAACVMSTWFWGCGAWPAMNQAETRYFVNTTWQLWALLLPHKPPDADFWSHSEIQLALNVPTPEDYLHEARLRHLGLLVKSGPKELWSLVLSSKTMREPLQCSLQWLQLALGGDCELGTPEEWGPWADMMQNNPARWKRIVAIAASRYQKFTMRNRQVAKWYGEMAQLLSSFELFQMADVTDSPVPTLPEYCIPCEKAFASRRAWFLHSTVVHGYISPPGRVARGDTCIVCKKAYPSQMALQRHLNYSKRCCSIFALTEMEANHESHASENHPQCPWRHVPLEDHLHQSDAPVDFEMEALHEQLDTAIQPFDLLSNQEENVTKVAGSLIDALHCVLPLPKIRVSFDAWISKLRPLSSCLDAALLHVVAWFAGLPAVQRPQKDESAMTTEQGRKRCLVHAAEPSPWGLLPRELFFLHFFSGRRRSTDLQAALERVVLPDGHQMWILSLDLQVCERRCNLLQPEQQQQWFRLIRERRVCGTAAGPPCETWSLARWMPPPDVATTLRRPPRPVRSREEPWGLLRVSAAESAQITIGSLLLQFALIATVLQALMNGFAVLEHPQDPASFSSDVRAQRNGSIWSLAAMGWLEATRRFTRVDTCQGHFGAPSRKPTTLLVANVSSSILFSLEKGLRTTSSPTEQSIGVGADGEWRTKRLKEYPEAFCALISHFFRAWLDDVWSLPPVDNFGAQDWLKDLHKTLDECPLQQQVGPDFRRDLAL